MHTETPTNALHGVMAEYDTGQALVDAARQTMAHGFTRVEAYTPVPIEELNDIIHKRRTILPKLVLAGGLTGMATGFALQYWASVIEYPMNVGGRPMASWTTFIVPSYELTILFASLTAAIGMVAAERPAAAVSPGVQRRALLDGELRQVLPGDRIDGREVRATRRERVPAQHRRQGSVRRCAVTSPSRSWRRRRCSPAAARTCTMRRATRHSKRAPPSRDNRASRIPPVGTVPRGWLREDEALYTGKVAGQLIDQFPFAIAHADLARGQQRFNIYCTPCHGKLGDGNGMVVQRGLRQAASFHQDRLRQEKIGYFFDVITNGFGAMPDYAAQIPVRDRWLIVAYVRTLQFSQHASVNELPPDQRAAIDAAATARDYGGPRQHHSKAGGETLVSSATTETYRAEGTPLPAMKQFGMIAGVLGVVLAIAGFFMSRRRALLPGIPGGLHVLDGRGARQPRAVDGAALVGRRVGRGAAAAVRSGGAHAAVHGAAVHPDHLRHARSLRVVARGHHRDRRRSSARRRCI